LLHEDSEENSSQICFAYAAVVTLAQRLVKVAVMPVISHGFMQAMLFNTD